MCSLKGEVVSQHLRYLTLPKSSCRCAFLGLLVYACGGHFVYEQPRSSLLFRHARMMWLCQKITAPKIAIELILFCHMARVLFVCFLFMYSKKKHGMGTLI